MQACLAACSLLPPRARSAGMPVPAVQGAAHASACPALQAASPRMQVWAPKAAARWAAPHLCGCSVPSSSQCAVSPPCDTTRCATSFTRARFQPASSERDHCRSSFHAAPLAVPRVPPSASSRKICRSWGGVGYVCVLCVWEGWGVSTRTVKENRQPRAHVCVQVCRNVEESGVPCVGVGKHWGQEYWGCTTCAVTMAVPLPPSPKAHQHTHSTPTAGRHAPPWCPLP